ncbi:hypothetical protein B0I00_1293 [Novosphingobium kunmingense]|uniref:DUF2384 domain-containing protein n=1 Tax=Novosphingobium kunmingense TaxID=1211806 RepID=A0A2N0HJE0_9SPHN|nr:hypothetical protein [Novosphingobium kunmingense]PKB19066.1 hypothetical protein B0I00_1293 [Novosphingobium kunmingense]
MSTQESEPASGMVAASPSEAGGKRRSLGWRKAAPRLPGQMISRQGQITHLAFALLGGREPALEFLNLYHAGLGAKPLDLAGGSDVGYSAVRGEINRLAFKLTGARQ